MAFGIGVNLISCILTLQTPYKSLSSGVEAAIPIESAVHTIYTKGDLETIMDFHRSYHELLS